MCKPLSCVLDINCQSSLKLMGIVYVGKKSLPNSIAWRGPKSPMSGIIVQWSKRQFGRVGVRHNIRIALNFHFSIALSALDFSTALSQVIMAIAQANGRINLIMDRLQ